MPRYKTAYELGLDALDLQLCLDTDYNQPDYDGARQPDDEPAPCPPPAAPATP